MGGRVQSTMRSVSIFSQVNPSGKFLCHGKQENRMVKDYVGFVILHTKSVKSQEILLNRIHRALHRRKLADCSLCYLTENTDSYILHVRCVSTTG